MLCLGSLTIRNPSWCKLLLTFKWRLSNYSWFWIMGFEHGEGPEDTESISRSPWISINWNDRTSLCITVGKWQGNDSGLEIYLPRGIYSEECAAEIQGDVLPGELHKFASVSSGLHTLKQTPLGSLGLARSKAWRTSSVILSAVPQAKERGAPVDLQTPCMSVRYHQVLLIS